MAEIDWDALAAAGLRLLGDYCCCGCGVPREGIFRVPGDGPWWYCKRKFIDRWIELGRPDLPVAEVRG